MVSSVAAGCRHVELDVFIDRLEKGILILAVKRRHQEPVSSDFQVDERISLAVLPLDQTRQDRLVRVAIFTRVSLVAEGGRHPPSLIRQKASS